MLQAINFYGTGLLKKSLGPLLTSHSGTSLRVFTHKARSPQVRVAHLHRTTAAFTPPRLGHKSVMDLCPLALLGSAFYAALVHRLAIYAPRFLPILARPHALALRFALLTVTSSQRDLHQQVCAHAGDIKKATEFNQ